MNIAVLDVFRLVVYTYFAGQQQQGVNVHYMQCLNIVGTPTDDNQVQSFATGLSSVYTPLMTDKAIFQGVTLQKWMPPTPLPMPVASTALNNPGVVTGDALPPDKAGIITWRTRFSGRKYRGRSYIPFPSETDSDVNGLPTNGYVLRLVTLAGIFVPFFTSSDMGGNQAGWVKLVVHGRTPGSPNDAVVTSLPRQLWADQHRRGDYGRRNTPSPF